jgi:copper chaperone CopZ
MKTSVIEVHDMLSVLSVRGVEKRIGEVLGVESVTVNYAAGNATVRFDETRLNIADIKSDVRQNAYKSAAPAAASESNEHKGHVAPAPPATPASAAAKSTPDGTAAGATPPTDRPKDKATPGSQTAAMIAAHPTSSPDVSTARAVPAVDGQKDKAAPDKS